MCKGVKNLYFYRLYYKICKLITVKFVYITINNYVILYSFIFYIYIKNKILNTNFEIKMAKEEILLVVKMRFVNYLI